MLSAPVPNTPRVYPGIVCPACDKLRVSLTARTMRGAYYRCETCAHLWHQDNDEAPPESKAEEHERLQDRTDEPGPEHAALSGDLTPFDQAHHDQDDANLQQHQEDPAAHKLRPDDDDKD
jgi:hypothetical protein